MEWNQRVRAGLGLVGILLISVLMAIAVEWRAPALKFYSHDWLMRWRGNWPVPEEIAIVAIDEASIARLGRFPWPRARMAAAIEALRTARPKAIALDVLYTDPSGNEAEDAALAAGIARAGNVVVAAQLTNEPGGAGWLRPLPAIAEASAATGHVNIDTGFDGIARSFALLHADDEGDPIRAMAIETLCVGEGISKQEARLDGPWFRLGARRIPLHIDSPSLQFNLQNGHTRIDQLPASRIYIDYIGPGGAFAAVTTSIADVIGGCIPAETFRGKYVLIGATAAGLGDRVASPFMHEEFLSGRQNGEFSPGVEILAHSLQTLLHNRFYHELSEGLSLLLVLLVAGATILVISLGWGRYETIKQLLGFGLLLSAIIGLSYGSFAYGLILPPLAPMLAACLTAAPLAWLRRSLTLSAELDERIAELAETGGKLPLSPEESAGLFESNPAALIAKLAGAEAVVILETRRAIPRVLASAGATFEPIRIGKTGNTLVPHRSVNQALVESEAASRYFLFAEDCPADFIQQARCMTLQAGEAGMLLLAYSEKTPLTQETLLLCREIAGASIESSGRDPVPARELRWWPRGRRSKAQTLGRLNRQMIARARFVERALHSVEDGLIVASPDGSILFANPRVREIFHFYSNSLIGSDLFELMATVKNRPQTASNGASRDILMRLIVEGAAIEQEISIGEAPMRHYNLRLSTVRDDEGRVQGIVASFSDITKQRQLQQTKNDVMALVSHEMKTPLTAIQGISEVLSKFEVDAARGRQMHLAIYEEAQRLARMIDEYLDITRLESGARHLRLEPVRPQEIIERVLLLLEPLAAQREIRIVRRLTPNLPALLLDADLISRALTNLLSNAVKFSAPKAEVILEVRLESIELSLEIIDQGCGIPAEALPRIFEKFYRVSRPVADQVPGTGLGLSLVREIAEMHSGRVTVESEVGVGSVFTLHLPLSRIESDSSKG